MDNVWLALAITTFAGLSTGVGSAIAFFAKRTNYRFLSVATGFSAGVMLYVSFVEILPKAVEQLAGVAGQRPGNLWGVVSFFGGIGLILLIDRVIPSAKNPHEVRGEGQFDAVHEGLSPQHALHASPEKLHRMGLLTALAIGIHNFPEGLATFLATLEDPHLGLAIGVAIALHNIPEGISVSVPIYFATGKRRRAFAYSVLSGVAEPAGALIGYMALRPFLGPQVMGALFGGVGGIMVYISLDELLPTSRAYGKGHDSLYGLLAGMAVMALSLVLMT
ncbi:MAG: zinc transporter ZupT [Planctomycetes bacterium]|jgi:ZIP family zinc transporter|nr:zinc transporter ZupT [Phycisphaerae bacterium]NBB95858.1 zinc transporter ZupT [Planctomycetota bacterium]